MSRLANLWEDTAVPAPAVEPIAFGAFKRIGVSAAIGLMRAQDRLRW